MTVFETMFVRRVWLFWAYGIRRRTNYKSVADECRKYGDLMATICNN